MEDREETRGLSDDRPVPPSKEDYDRARKILDRIGRSFAENRKKGKSTAFEQYQKDIAENLDYIVAGGVMNLKEVSQTLMQLEEYRKQGSEQGKTSATLLSEWLRGDSQEEF